MTRSSLKTLHSISTSKEVQFISTQRLCALVGAPHETETVFDSHTSKNDTEIGGMLDRALVSSASFFPMLPEGVWHALLTLLQPFKAEGEPMMFQQLLRRDYLSFHLPAIISQFSDEDRKNLGFHLLEGLTSAEIFAASLISDRFWTPKENEGYDLRSVLSEVSGRPKECVFSDDPSPEYL
jgi:hypothetical protein